MATVRSKLGEHPVPKPKNQGSSTSAHKQAPKVARSNGGFQATPGSLAQPKRGGVTPKARGGSGTGARKGNSLPR